MLISWYSNGFWLACLSLALWQYYKDREAAARLLQLIFAAGIFIYAVSFSFIPQKAGDKLLFLARDLMVLGASSYLFQFLRPYKHVFWLVFFSFVLLVKVFFIPRMVSFTNGEHQEFENEWELLIQLKEDGRLQDLDDIIQKYKLIIEPSFAVSQGSDTELDQYFSVEIPATQEKWEEKITQELKGKSIIEWIEKNEKITVFPTEIIDEYRTDKTLQVNDPHVNKQWAWEVMGWAQAYALLNNQSIRPSATASLVILDTGIDGKHEDLTDNYVSIKSNYDFDDKGHGTHVAGIAGAVTNNNKGIASVNSQHFFTISSIKVLGSLGIGTQRTIINGIIEAADKGASVINMSLGGRSLDAKQKAYAEAVRYANQRGAIVVVAAGNDHTDARSFAPANVDGVITVSAVDSGLLRSSFSNSVEYIKYKIAAPGVNIFSTIPGNQYASYNGTSMAAPYVSGLIAVMKSLNPALTTAEVYSILANTGTAGLNLGQTGAIIHAGKAIDQVIPKAAL